MAANLAGLNVQYLGVEPSMACMGHNYYATEIERERLKYLNKDLMVFDFGGGTLDCSRLRCVNLQCTVLGISGNSSLGGIDFDHVIAEILEEKIKNDPDMEITKRLQAEIASESEGVKLDLTEIANDINIMVETKEVEMTEEEIVKLKKLRSTTVELHDDYGYGKEIKISLYEFENHPKTKQLLESAVETAMRAMNKEHSQDTVKQTSDGKYSNLRAVKLSTSHSIKYYIQKRAVPHRY